MPKLSDTKVKTAPPKEKQYKIFDTDGLFILIAPSGGKWWRLRYRYGGREKLLSLGTYPRVTLKMARDRRDAALKQLEQGIDPSAARKAEKAAGTFQALADEWHTKFRHTWAKSTARIKKVRLNKHVMPYLGHMAPNKITSPEVLAVLRRLENAGKLETAHKVRQYLAQIFRYALASGQVTADPVSPLQGAIAPPKVTGRAAITDLEGLGGILRAVDGYDGNPVVRAALRLLPLLLVRPGELRHAEWQEIDFDAATWRIPGTKMKNDLDHVVPLPKQAVEILRELHKITGKSRYCFPSVRTLERPISDGTLNAAFRRMGYGKNEVTGHGFRKTGSTILNEQGFNPDWIERQLAHVERNKIRGTYNAAEYLPGRIKMLQNYADFLDGLRLGSADKVVNIKTA